MRRRTGPRIGAVLAALALAAAGAGCLRQPDRYETAPVVMGDIRDVVPAVGEVQALSQIEVRPDRPGRVVEVLVEANATVRRGQPLARLKPDRLALDVESARAEQAAAQAALVEARTRREQADKALANRRTLAERDFISPAALSEAEANARAATAVFDRARAQADQAAVRVRSAASSLEDIIIRAPSEGIVLARNVEAGQLATPERDPLFLIVSALDRVLIEARVAEPDIGRITPGVRVAFSVEAWPGVSFSGRLREVLRSPVRDRNFVSYPVIIEADNPDQKLFPGMTAAVEFIHSDVRNVIRAPVEALYFKPENYRPRLPPDLERKLKRLGLDDPIAADGAEMGRLFATGRQRVFVMTRDGPSMRAIRIGAESARFVEVTEGLRVGETLIVSANAPADAR